MRLGLKEMAEAGHEGIPVGLVHGSRLLREGVGNLLAQAGIHVVATFGSGRDVLESKTFGECVLLYDMATARGDGPEAVMEVHRRLPEMKLLMFNVDDDDHAIVECVRVGASGCVLQDATLEDLVGAIRSLASGAPPLSSRVITSLFSYIASLSEGDRRPVAPLTRREEQVLALLADGLSNKEIADRLVLQPQTVKNYVHLVLQKLGLHTRLEVIRSLRSQRH